MPITVKNDLSDLVCFNVGGKKFYCMRENFLRMPTTRLGLLVRFNILLPFYAKHIFTLFSKVQCEDSLEILKLCDRYFEGDIPEYFFDR